MAALPANLPTLLDLAKSQDPDGNTADIVEILNQVNEVLDDMVWTPGNLTTGHTITIRSGLPAPTWTKLGQGIVPSKSTLAQVNFQTARLEAMSEVDDRLIDLAQDKSGFRLQEDTAHIQGISHDLAQKIFYGNDQLTPEEFMGLSPYYNTRTKSVAESAENVIHGGGSGTDNGSIWLVVWGPQTIHGIVPKNTKAGLQVEDLGRDVLDDASNGSNTGRMLVWRTMYRQYAGLVVRDWRYAVRIANIDKSDLTEDAASGANLHSLMFKALRKVPSLSVGRPVFYMSRDMATMLFQQNSSAVKNSTLQSANVGGKILDTFNGIPIKRVDALSADEALVS